jgi:hypothetical protein
MRPQITMLVATLTLFSPGIASAQSNQHGPDSLFARLSYSSTYGIDWRVEKGSPQVCLALYRNGYYQISRMTEGGTETLQGTLSRDQLLLIGRMLGDLDFQASAADVVRQGSESFIAEIVREGKALHSVWIDPDHQRPFPNSVISIVNWLRNFSAKGASPLTQRELSEQPICPPPTLKAVQPAIGRLHTTSVGGACEVQRP